MVDPRHPNPRNFLGALVDLLRALRPLQWAKNLLLAVPLLAAHQLHDRIRLVNVALSIGVFCLLASAGYIVNDLLDRERDRLHPRKQNRPFAAGRLSLSMGLVMILLLTTAGLALSAWRLDRRFTAAAAVYLALSVTYSLYLKRKLIIDVIVLAGLYTLRIVAGGLAAQLPEPVSAWLLALSMFLFLSLAFAKRYAELRMIEGADADGAHGRGYMLADEPSGDASRVQHRLCDEIRLPDPTTRDSGLPFLCMVPPGGRRGPAVGCHFAGDAEERRDYGNVLDGGADRGRAVVCDHAHDGAGRFHDH